MKGIYFRGAGSSVPVSVTSEGWELRLEADGEPRALRLEHAKLELGGDQSSYLVATFPGEPEEVLYLQREGLLEALEAGGAPTEVLAEVRELVAAHRKRWVKRRVTFLGVALAGLLVSVAAVVALVLSARSLAVAAVPPSWEEQMGATAYEKLQAEWELEPAEPELQVFVDAVGQRLAASRPEQPYRLRFVVVRDPMVNAIALPGGNPIVVFTGLIAAAESPEEVAAVIGHEIGHVLERHHAQRAVDRLGTLAALSVALGDFTQIVVAYGALATAQDVAFGPDQERAADALGVTLLHEAGISPDGAVSFFAGLAEGEGEWSRAKRLLSTHPPSAERSAALAAQIERLPPKEYEPLDVDWPRLQALAGPSE